MTQILDGKTLNEKIAEELSNQITKLDPKPKLVIIQIGNLPESNAYIGRKIKFGQKIGATVDLQKFEEDVTQEDLVSKIKNLNSDPTVHGIIVQLPIAKHLDKDEVIDTINPKKDVDGLTSVNLKHLWEGKSDGFVPATTKGVITLIDSYQIPIERQNVVVVGRSSLVGKPTALAFLMRDATVTICHKATKNLPAYTKTADIIVVATGKPNLIGKEHVTKGQIVIDVGINAVENEDSSHRKLVGDVNFAEVSPIVEAITPVPGGVGPMTVASLFQNLLQAYGNQK